MRRRTAVGAVTVLALLAWGAEPALASHDRGDPNIRVRLLAFDNLPTLATSPGGVVVSGVGGSHPAVIVSQIGTNVFDIQTGPGCGGPWSAPVARIGGPVDIHPAAGGEANFVQACEATGRRAYRGFLRATRDSEGPQRTVNVVDMEDYLKGVVPRESPASWGDLAGGAGMHALRAQAVAARSYAAAEHRYSYGDTCDSTACQVYAGYWDTTFGVREDSRTNRAIAETAGEVRHGSGVQRTEFSSSTGGHSAGGTFPAVVDDGDDTSSNPNHRWTTGIATGTIQSKYPSIGAFTGISINGRNGMGEWGGRVTSILITGTAGNVTKTGNEFRVDFGLKSDWYTITEGGADGTVDLLGAGWGHGRGLGQYGALGYAIDHAWGYQQILGHFYSNTAAGFLPSGGVLGYWVMDTVGGIFTFGAAAFHGSVPGLRQQGVSIGNAPIVDVEPTPTGNGYWVLDRAGGIFSFGDAQFFGSIPGLRNAGIPVGPADVIDLASTPSGRGYWLLDGAGGMFAFGDAQFFGSVPELRNQGVSIGPAAIVDMTTTPGGTGYVMVDNSGGVFAFGNAPFFGSIPGLREAGVQIGRATVVGIATKAGGYWMLDDRGGVFAFGDAPFHGSLPGAGISVRAAGIAPTKTGGGYLIVAADNGEVYAFGDAPDFGGIPDTGIQSPGRGIAARYEP